VDGFVISSVNYNDPRASYLLAQPFPFVAFGRASGEYDFPWVDVDGTAGVRLAVEHLLARGHRKIAALAWPETSRVGNERLSGYTAALAAAGLMPDPAWVIRAHGTYELARANTDRLLELPQAQRPTAVVTMNDVMAIGALQAAQARGLTVGSDFAVVGFDDSPVAQYLWPPLTTVHQPISESGHKIVEMLVRTIRGETLTERQVLLQPQLIVRASG
jgi:DNA-binding LacI/PurR family transcriptional regulator